MSIVALALAVLAAASGIVAAWYWFLSTRVKIEPAWMLDVGGPEGRNIMGHVTGVMIAFNEGSKLSRLAALWTAGSVVLTGLSAVIGSLAHLN